MAVGTAAALSVGLGTKVTVGAALGPLGGLAAAGALTLLPGKIAGIRDLVAKKYDNCFVKLFVEVEISGKIVENVVTLPRSALLKDDSVLIIDGERRLFYRSVDVLRRAGSKVLITGGVKKGELVCLTSLPSVVEGMDVRLAEESQLRVSTTTDGKQKH